MSRAPAVDIQLRTVQWPKAQIRRPCGTSRQLLTAAFFRTWRGSQPWIAQDPTFIALKSKPFSTEICLGQEL